MQNELVLYCYNPASNSINTQSLLKLIVLWLIIMSFHESFHCFLFLCSSTSDILQTHHNQQLRLLQCYYCCITRKSFPFIACSYYYAFRIPKWHDMQLTITIPSLYTLYWDLFVCAKKVNPLNSTRNCNIFWLGLLLCVCFIEMHTQNIITYYSVASLLLWLLLLCMKHI